MDLFCAEASLTRYTSACHYLHCQMNRLHLNCRVPFNAYTGVCFQKSPLRFYTDYSDCRTNGFLTVFLILVLIISWSLPFGLKIVSNSTKKQNKWIQLSVLFYTTLALLFYKYSSLIRLLKGSLIKQQRSKVQGAPFTSAFN